MNPYSIRNFNYRRQMALITGYHASILASHLIRSGYYHNGAYWLDNEPFLASDILCLYIHYVYMYPLRENHSAISRWLLNTYITLIEETLIEKNHGKH